jgi:hypothetical protein
MMRIVAFLLALLLGMTGGVGNAERNYQKEISRIYVYHSGFGMRSPEYLIDIENKTVFQFKMGEDYQKRDEMAENEGFTFVRELSDEGIEIFIRESARFGFTNWDEKYYDERVMDGHQWGITICFADSEKKEVYGSNAYPETWEDMAAAFINLASENVFLHKFNWLH